MKAGTGAQFWLCILRKSELAIEQVLSKIAELFGRVKNSSAKKLRACLVLSSPRTMRRNMMMRTRKHREDELLLKAGIREVGITDVN